MINHLYFSEEQNLVEKRTNFDITEDNQNVERSEEIQTKVRVCRFNAILSGHVVD